MSKYDVISIYRVYAFSETTLGKSGHCRATSRLILYIGVGCQVSAKKTNSKYQTIGF
jgi:hypothetical protein